MKIISKSLIKLLIYDVFKVFLKDIFYLKKRGVCVLGSANRYFFYVFLSVCKNRRYLYIKRNYMDIQTICDLIKITLTATTIIIKIFELKNDK